MQRALKAAKFRSGKATGYFGKPTAIEVARFQRSVGIRPATGRYGLRTHRALSKYYDAQGRARLIQVAKARKLAARELAVKTVTTHAFVVGGNTLVYSESASRGFLPAYPRLPPATDCAGYVTWVYKSIGLTDPNGLNYNPVGWTGTLGRHGVIEPASRARVGDLVFYGGGYPFGHVAIYIGNGRVSSHGETGIHDEPITYRPVSQVRRYF
jgi:cell wall-associated NlpC family hydrolase